VWRDNRGHDMLAVQVATESTKPIRGYLVINSFLDPITGTVTRRISTKVLERQGNPSEVLASGSAWVITSRKFSHFAQRCSAEVLGMFHGIDAQIT
jgi:hypothetical protein